MERANGTGRCMNGSSNIDVLSDLAAGILRVQVCTRWQSRRISARGRDWDSGNGRLSAVFAAWGCVSMAQLANGNRGQWPMIMVAIPTMKTMRMGGRWSEGIDNVRSGQIERSRQTRQV